MSAYHRWLINQRIFCEHDLCMKRATKVVNVNGTDRVMCDFHRFGVPDRKELMKYLMRRKTKSLTAVPVLAEPPKKPEDQSTGQVTVAIESALEGGEARESTTTPPLDERKDSCGGSQTFL